MTKARVIDSMIDDIISIYGFEDERTIYFCKLAEKICNMWLLKKLYRELISEAGYVID